MDKQSQKEMKIHKASYFMYEKTKKECLERMSEAMNPDGSKRWSQEEIDEKLKMIQTMQDDVREKFLISGGNPDELIVEAESTTTNMKPKKPIEKKKTEKTSLVTKKKTPLVRKEKEEKVIENMKEVTKSVQTTSKVNEEEISVVPKDWSITDFSDSFDVIPLPSRGECYDSNLSTIAVSYLTANDENMIVSPNLYREKRKTHV